MVRVSSGGQVVVSPRGLCFWFAWSVAAWKYMPLVAWSGDPLLVALAWDGLEFL